VEMAESSELNNLVFLEEKGGSPTAAPRARRVR